MLHSADDAAAVGRLYDHLVHALEQRRGADFAGPVTVAEIYQELVPYRAVRSEVGFGMNADYEHALLRLLSGEAGLARLEPDSARAEIETELESANPNVSIYRAYAGCDVWIRSGTGGAGVVRPQQAEQPSRAPAAPEPPRTAAAARASAPPGSVAAEPLPARPEEPRGRGRPAAEPDPVARIAAPVRSAECVACAATLPGQRTARFCPFCGASQATRPCPSCGEAVEPGWRYCIACGAADSRVRGNGPGVDA
jgi:hypothetical protein